MSSFLCYIGNFYVIIFVIIFMSLPINIFGNTTAYIYEMKMKSDALFLDVSMDTMTHKRESK